MDKRILAQYNKVIEDSTPVSPLKALTDEIRACDSFEQAKPKIVEYMSICSNSPCCNQPFVPETGECMSIKCSSEDCGVNFCGFCHKMAHEVPELCVQEHVSVCCKNPNQSMLELTIMKSPYENDFHGFQLRRRIQLFNSLLRLVHIDGDYMSWFNRHFADFERTIGGMYLDKDKYGLGVMGRNGDVVIRYKPRPEVIDLTQPDRVPDGQVIRIDLTHPGHGIRVDFIFPLLMMMQRVHQAGHEEEPVAKRRRT